MPPILQNLANAPSGTQLACNVGSEPEIALGVEPAGFDIGRQLAHGLRKCRENLLDLSRSEPSFPGHARHLSGVFKR